MNQEALDAVYLFIAELNGYKTGTLSGKLAYGKECYANRVLPEMSDDVLHEIIWLERLYDELMAYYISNDKDNFHWSVPIELDASASMLSYIGTLIGDKRLMTMTNLIGDEDSIDDPWKVEGLSRNHVKKVATPRLYGSSQPAAVLWAKNKLDYTLDDLKLINNELKNGALGLADRFKEFIIKNCNPKAVMNVDLYRDKFEVSCTRWKRVGDVTVQYDLYDTESGAVKRISHTKTKAVPDLEGFRLYWVTCLIHGLDSQVANAVAEKVMDKYGFCIDIHDAFIVAPQAAADVRKWYAEEMDLIFANRKEILQKYFTSIGITAASAEAWEAVMEAVVPVDADVKCRGAVLK